MNRRRAQKRGREIVYNRGDGVSHSILGYDDNYLIIESEANTVRYIYTLFVDERLSLNAIASKLNTDAIYKTKKGRRFYAQQIKCILSRPEYCGMTYDYKKTKLIVSNVYEPIVSESVWMLAQDLKTLKMSISSPHKNDKTSLSGKICCELCSKQYYLQRNSYVHAKNSDCIQSGKSINRLHIDKYINAVFYRFISEPLMVAWAYDWLVEMKRIKKEFFYDLSIELNLRLRELNKEIHLIQKKNVTYKDNNRLTRLSNSYLLLSERLRNIKKQSNKDVYQFLHQIINQWYFSKKGNKKDVCDLLFTYILIDRKKGIKYKICNTDMVSVTYKKSKNIISKTLFSKQQISEAFKNDKEYKRRMEISRAMEEDERYSKNSGKLIEPYELYKYQVQAKKSKRVKYFLKNDSLALCSNANNRLDLSNVYRINNRGSFYYALQGQEIKVNITLKNNEVVFLLLNNYLYVNRRFINKFYTLSPTLFTIESSFLRVDNKRITLYQEDNKVIAYDLRIKKVVTLETVNQLIKECTRFELVFTQ